MRARVLSLAAAVTVYSKEPDSLMVPANTGSPSAFSTGRLSPVMGAWLIAERPLTIFPSSAIRSPGLIRTRASTATDLAATSCQLPSACKTVARSGVNCINPRMAFRARSSDLASISSAIVNNTITIAASGHCPRKSAPVTAMLIKALMLRLPLRMAIQPFL